MPWESWTCIWIILPLFSSVVRVINASSTPFVQVSKNELQHQVFTAPNANGYKSIKLHDNVLYVGGQGTLFRQNPANISKSLHPEVEWSLPNSKISVCQSLPKGKNGTCRNYIQTIQPYNGTHLLLCGTWALSPKNKFLSLRNGTLHDSDIMPTPLCSYDPKDSVVSALGTRPVSENGPFASIAGTSREQDSQYFMMSVVKNVIDGQTLRPTLGERKMIDTDADFVYSFSTLDEMKGQKRMKMYFVFGESTREPEVHSHKHGARIAQVCANDEGSNYQHRWTSFLKVSLLCQSNEASPYPFDVVTHSTLSDNGTVLYGTFTTQSFQFRDSAVCAFRLSDIQKAFHRKTFWEVNNDMYEHMDESKVPSSPSPGDCAPPGETSKNYSDEFVRFMEAHPLVANPVTPIFPPNPTSSKSGPLLFQDRKNFTAIAEQTVRDVDNRQHSVLFVGTDAGKIIKFFSVFKDNKEENIQLAEFSVADEAITGLVKSNSYKQLYVNTDSSVLQIPTGNCEIYTSSCKFCDPCRMCVLSRDPMCAWDKNPMKCVDIRSVNTSKDLYQDVLNGNIELCGDVRIQVEAKKDQQIGYPVILGDAISGQSINVKWFKRPVGQDRYLIESSSKYRVTSDGRLEISVFSDEDLATFTAEHTVSEVLVSNQSFQFANDPIITPSLSTTELPKDTVSPDGVTSVVIDGPKPTANTSTVPPVEITTTAVVVPPMPMPVAIIVLICLLTLLVAAVICLYVYCIIYKKNKLPCKKGKDQAYQINVEPAIPLTQGNDFGESAKTRHDQANNSSNKTTEFKLSDKYSHHVKEETVPLLESSPPISTPKKVANVLPVRQTPDKIAYIDEGVPAIAEPEHARKPPQRAKSIQSQNVRVKLDNNKVVKCNSIHRHKGKGTFFLEINLPDDYEFDNADGTEQEISYLDSDFFEAVSDFRDDLSDEEALSDKDSRHRGAGDNGQFAELLYKQHNDNEPHSSSTETPPTAQTHAQPPSGADGGAKRPTANLSLPRPNQPPTSDEVSPASAGSSSSSNYQTPPHSPAKTSVSNPAVG